MSAFSRLAATGLLACGLAGSVSAQLTLSLEPANPGPGDPVDIVLKGGEEGDYTLVLAALDAGPTTFPLVGTLEVGLDSLTLYPLGQFDSTGCLRFPCALDCFAATVDPFYLQGITVRLTPGGPIVPSISNPLVFSIDDDNIEDCNDNGFDDDCDIEEGRSRDCNGNGIPDECELDCNANGVPDDCDIAMGSSTDLNDNGVPDECEPDCNGNQIPDDVDIADGFSADCDANGVPDECQPDCDGDGIPDACDGIVNSYCIEDMTDENCTSGTFDRVVWIREISPRFFTLVDGGQFIEYEDGTGKFSGVIENVGDDDKAFAFDMCVSGRVDPGDASWPPAGSPKLSGNCDKDTANWYYYTEMTGTFTGLGDYAGASYDICIRGPAFQVGAGANLFNAENGAATWFDMKRTSKPKSGSLPKEMEGDFNLDLVSSCDCD